MPLHLIVRIPILRRMDLKTSSIKINNNMVAISRDTSNKTSVVTTMVRIEVATSRILNKIATSLDLLLDLVPGRDLGHRTLHHSTEGVVDISIIYNGMPPTSVEDHKIRISLGAMQGQTIHRPHLRLR